MENVLILRIKNDLTKFFNTSDYVYNHSLRVYHSVLNHYPNNSLSLAIIAILHDVVEDTEYNLEKLKNMYFNDFCGFLGNTETNLIFNAIDVITRKKDETYTDYINRVKLNKYATIVKILDLEDNLFSCYKDKNISLSKRYLKALKTIFNL